MDYLDTDTAIDAAAPLEPAGTDGAFPGVIVDTKDLDTPIYTPVSLLCAATPAPVVASCPHAGRDYPAPLTEAAVVTVDDMRGLEDFAMDQLMGGLAAQGITCLINRLARAYIDVNRPAGALDAAMFDTPIDADKPSRQVAAGYGLIPRLSANRQPLYSAALPACEITRRLAVAYAPYHTMLAAQIAAAKAEHGHCLLVDVHSMPPRDRTNRKLADIVLSDCLGVTLDSHLTKPITDFFTEAGLSVAWNDPYAGGYITRTHGRIGTDEQSIQIEINRAIYMQNAAAPERTPHIDKTKAAAISALLGRFGAFLIALKAPQA